jgi:hypothetical protein
MADQDNITDLLAAGRRAADSQLWRQAINLLRPIATTGNTEALMLLSDVLCAAGRPAEASHLLGPVAAAAGAFSVRADQACV